uniref:Uncharacterized protein n=1 Tax=Oryza meridionalis TaxID=40149 RepID=A0A0E0DPL1_9ORYZ
MEAAGLEVSRGGGGGGGDVMVVLPQQEEAAVVASVESKGVHVIGSRIYDPENLQAQQHEHRSMHMNSQSTTNATLPNDITDWEGEGEMRKRLTCGPILVLDPDQVHEGSMWHMPTLSHGADQGLAH